MVKNVDRLFPKAQGDLLLTQRYREAEISIWAFYLKKITQNVKKNLLFNNKSIIRLTAAAP